ncbi:MAG: hypothetical protein FLDDKLPJ_00858 [Phycisphaerae bacterium]|nr:hypothetical protein [Phycisphaerae bacterium]
MSDRVDLILEQWRRERPDVNVESLGLVNRVLALAKHLEDRANEALAPFGLQLWQYDVLSALRRAGPEYALSPSELCRVSTLSCGAMTHRLDRLEEAGLVRREPDPADRRGLRIRLTEAGRTCIDAALEPRVAQAARFAETLPVEDRAILAELLRRLLMSCDRSAAPEPDPASSASRRSRAGRRRSRLRAPQTAPAWAPDGLPDVSASAPRIDPS